MVVQRALAGWVSRIWKQVTVWGSDVSLWLEQVRHQGGLSLLDPPSQQMLQVMVKLRVVMITILGLLMWSL